MKYDTLKLLCCPICKGDLTYKTQIENGEIQEGRLCCKGCDRDYPIKDGIPRFITRKELIGSNLGFERFYDWFSNLYDSIIMRFVWQRLGGEENARNELLGKLEVRDGSKILETGVGTGGNFHYLINYTQGLKIYGLDSSISMLKKCNKNLNKWRIQAELFLGNAEKLPFRDDSFDIVYHMGGINFFTEKRKSIEDMIKVSKFGTKIVIIDETREAWRRWTGWKSLDKYIYKPVVKILLGRATKYTLSFDEKEMLMFVPANMLEVKFDYIWKGVGYRLEFRKP